MPSLARSNLCFSRPRSPVRNRFLLNASSVPSIARPTSLYDALAVGTAAFFFSYSFCACVPSCSASRCLCSKFRPLCSPGPLSSSFLSKKALSRSSGSRGGVGCMTAASDHLAARRAQEVRCARNVRRTILLVNHGSEIAV